jgi:hypothetical protein
LVVTYFTGGTSLFVCFFEFTQERLQYPLFTKIP